MSRLRHRKAKSSSLKAAHLRLELLSETEVSAVGVILLLPCSHPTLSTPDSKEPVSLVPAKVTQAGLCDPLDGKWS